MTGPKNLYPLFFAVLLFSCDGKIEVKVKDVTLTAVKDDTVKTPPIPPVPTGLKVAAYLIYKDSSTSSFDVLNDKRIVLWNTIGGGGDALKPSVKTKVKLTGKLDSLKVTIYNGDRRVINERLPNFSGDFEFIIANTGCEVVKVIVTKLNKVVYQNKIPFRCGE